MDLIVGKRASMQVRLDSPDPATGARFTELVGEVVSVTPDEVVLRTAAGERLIGVGAITAARTVAPKATRRGAPHRALSIDDLERVMVDAWPPVEAAHLGDWVLRAAGGFTRRANSVVAVGEPGLPLDAAVAAVESWYAARGLPTQISLAADVGSEVWETPVGAACREHGYAAHTPTLVLTAAARAVASWFGAPGPLEVEVSDVLADDWLGAFGSYRPVDEAAARAVVTGSHAQVFATVRDAGSVVGIGRLGVSGDGWAGVGAMWVDPGHRRRGIASDLLTTIARAAMTRGVHSLHLQVGVDNEGAQTLYRLRGFSDHHAYSYLAR